MDINEILSKSQYFLRVYEFGKKFGAVHMKDSKEQKIVRKLPSCIRVKFDGYDIVSNEFSRKVRRHFTPINVIYKPVKNKTNKILCYSTTNISKRTKVAVIQTAKLNTVLLTNVSIVQNSLLDMIGLLGMLKHA